MRRRRFLQITAGLTLAGCRPDKKTPTSPDTDTDTTRDTGGSGDTAEVCGETSSNIEGPFYREEPPSRELLDLYAEAGTPVQLEGSVLDADCQPIAGAEIDFWHADPDGSYDLKSSEMAYYGRVSVDASGRWSLQTLLPGFYLNGDQYRPAHIHAKVWVGGEERLTTQLYFRDDPYLDIDPYVQDDLIMDFADRDGARIATFDFVLV